MNKKRVVVLISGRGSNLAALIADAGMLGAEGSKASGAGESYEIVGVVSNKADAGGLQLATDAGIATRTLDHKAFSSRDAFDHALTETVAAFSPDLVVLAGFMRILGAPFVSAFAGKLINIHPSLLPAFPGLDTHARALAAGCNFAGCTVHFVTPVLDDGPIIAQATVPILPEDTPSALAARVLEQEHVVLPQAVRDFCAARLVVEGQRVCVNREL